MDGLIVGIGIIAVVTVIAVVWWLRSKQRAERLERVKEMQYLLDRVAEAASKRKTELYQSLDGQDNQAIQALKQAAESSPVDISKELAELDALWGDLNRQIGEFSSQSVQSTLRSTVVTSQAAQVATQISHLVSSTKDKLSA